MHPCNSLKSRYTGSYCQIFSRAHFWLKWFYSSKIGLGNLFALPWPFMQKSYENLWLEVWELLDGQRNLLTDGADYKGPKSGSKTLEMLKRFKRCLVVRSMKKMFQYQTASYWSYLMTAECFRKNYPVSSVIPSYYMLSLHPLYVTIMRVQFSSIWCGLSVTEEDKWGLYKWGQIMSIQKCMLEGYHEYF